MNGLPTLPKPTPMVLDSLYNHSATLLNSGGDILEFSSLKHKLVLVVNIGLEEETLVREISHLERLAEKFSKDGLVILVFPCQQFSQTKLTERDVERKLEEVKNPNSTSETMVTFSPIKVNGDAHPLYRYLCHTIPMPADDPITFINDPDRITWRPVLRSDIAGNYEKFLILPNGRPYKRYSSHFLTTNLGYDLKVVIKTLENVRREETSGIKYILT